ncbi:MAG: hypothetical protein AAB799_00985 [Patescibacteria group bacterium]
MVKTRVQLSAIVLLLGYLGYLLLAAMINNTSKVPDWKTVLVFLDITFLTATLGILSCTFIRAKQLSNGSVCFMPNHPLVKLNFVSKEGTNLCPTFWLIGGIITAIGYVILLTVGLLAQIVTETLNGNFVQGIGLPVLIFIGCIGVLVLICWLATLDLWVWKVPITVLTFCVALTLLYLLPMGVIEENYNIRLNDSEAWVAGTFIYLKWLGVVVGSLTIAVASIYLSFKHWGVLSNSWLGKQIAMLKEKLCVRFVECNQG